MILDKAKGDNGKKRFVFYWHSWTGRAKNDNGKSSWRYYWPSWTGLKLTMRKVPHSITY